MARLLPLEENTLKLVLNGCIVYIYSVIMVI